MVKEVETTETALVIPQVEFQDVEIKFDTKPLQEKVTELQKKYDGYVVTEENLSDDKTLRADLNKTVKALKETKQTVVKEYNKPLAVFTESVDKAISDIDTISKTIDDQIKEFEKKQKEERRANVQAVVDANIIDAELNEKYTSQFMFDEKWLNSSKSQKSILEEIQRQIEQLKQAQKNEEEIQRQKAEQLKQKVEMAETLCKMQSQALGLNTPITIEDLGSIEHLEIAQISDFVTSAANRAKERETPKETQPTIETIPSFVNVAPTPNKKQPVTIKKLTLEFIELTDEQSTNLKAYIKTNNLKVNTLEVIK